MRRILLATTAFAFSAGMAMAADSANVEITAENPAACEIVTASSSLNLGTVVETYVPGDFTYQCNFVGSPTLTFTSLNGGVVNGAYSSDYGIYLNDAPASGTPSVDWLQASGTPAVYFGITSTVAPNTPTSPSFAVALTEPLEVAGLYSDTLTISIAP